MREEHACNLNEGCISQTYMLMALLGLPPDIISTPAIRAASMADMVVGHPRHSDLS